MISKLQTSRTVQPLFGGFNSNNGEFGSDDNNTLIDKRNHPQELSHGPRISPENHCFVIPNLGVSDVQTTVPSITQFDFH